MPEFHDLMLMDTRANVLASGGLVIRLVKNAEADGPRRIRKRRGFDTAVTVSATFGAAPYTLIPWTYGGSTVLVAVGTGAFALVNPVNDYLYTRLAALTADRIWSAVGAAAATAWGLAAPTIGTLLSNTAVGASCLSVGQYKLAITAWDETRRVESPPTFVSSASAASPWQPSSAVQGVLGPAYSITFAGGATLTEGTHGRLYAKRLITLIGSSPGDWAWRPTDGLGLLNLRQVEQKVEGAGWKPSTYTANAPEGGILDYAAAVCPYGETAIWHDGRAFYAGGTAGAGLCGPNTVVYSNPACPETYCGPLTVGGQSVTPTMAYNEERGIVQGLGFIDLPCAAGPIVALVSFNDRLLAVCQNGAWEITRSPDGIGYGYSQDMYQHGCVGKATVAHSAFGVFWLCPAGIVLWDGSGAPKLISTPLLDPQSADIDFADDLSAACAAFDHRYERLVIAYPTSAAGQNILALEIGLWMRGYPAWSRWSMTGTVTGLGWDSINQALAMCIGGSWYRQATGYADAGLKEYPFGARLLYSHAEGRVLANPTVRLVPLRPDSTVEQTVAFTVQGMPTADETAGDPTPATWALATAYAVGERVKPAVATGYWYRCAVAGTSGGVAPTWPTTLGGTVTDGAAPTQITWTCDHEAFTANYTCEWLAGEVRSKAAGPATASGRVLRITLENTDAYPLELSALAIDATEMGERRTDE